MIRISHKNLESARANPRLLLPKPGGGFQGGPSGMQYFKWALQKHIYAGVPDEDAAADYIEKGMTARRRDVRGVSRRCFSDGTIAKYLTFLRTYLKTMPNARPVRFQDRLSIGYLEKVQVCGIIDRVDVTSTGYAIWVFEQSLPTQWRGEIRFPLLQGFYEGELEARPSEVAVGVYDASTGVYESETFSKRKVTAATTEMESIIESALG